MLTCLKASTRRPLVWPTSRCSKRKSKSIVSKDFPKRNKIPSGRAMVTSCHRAKISRMVSLMDRSKYSLTYPKTLFTNKLRIHHLQGYKNCRKSKLRKKLPPNKYRLNQINLSRPKWALAVTILMIRSQSQLILPIVLTIRLPGRERFLRIWLIILDLITTTSSNIVLP